MRLSALHMRHICCLTATIVLLISLASGQTTTSEFTIVALPDTQFYSKSYPQIFASETAWVAQHAAEKNIKLVIGLGDIVDGGGEVGQWQNADAAIRNLDRKVPYMLAIGNHDYDRNNPPGRTASATNFNAFFGPSRFADRSWYRGNFPANSNENFYGVFTFVGRSYLVLVLEVFPRDSALTWAAGIIKSHPDSDVIVVTHSYTYYDNTRMDRCDTNSAATFGAGADNDGEQIWEKLVSKYPNIVMVLSGHVVQGDGTGRRTDVGVNGNLVNQMLADFQSYENGGNGFIRLITIRPATNEISVKTYSPYLNSYLVDGHNQFTVPYKNIGLTASTQAVHGVVKNVANCAALGGAGVSIQANTGTSASDGRFSVDAAGPASRAMKVAYTGFGTAPRLSASVIAGQPAPVKVMMSTSGVLRGNVSLNGTGVSGASVSVSGGALRTLLTTKTSADGSFSFGWVAIGAYKLTAGASGIVKRTTVSVGTGAVTSVSVELK